MVLFKLLNLELHSRRRHRLASLAVESKALQQPLGLSGVRFVFNASVDPTNNPIQYRELLGVLGTRPQAASFLKFIFFL